MPGNSRRGSMQARGTKTGPERGTSTLEEDPKGHPLRQGGSKWPRLLKLPERSIRSCTISTDSSSENTKRNAKRSSRMSWVTWTSWANRSPPIWTAQSTH
jgi:hypothetical protein